MLQIDLAIKMLRNMGEKISEHIEEITLNTSRRTVRASLLPLLHITAETKQIVGIIIM